MLQTRTANVSDAALIAAHRRAMFEAMGGYEEPVLDAVRQSAEPWTARMMEQGKYLGWITEDWIREDGRPIASAGMLILDWAPHALDPAGENRAYLLNVFVEPEYRLRGLARALLATCLAEARRRKIRVVALHASPEGVPLYQSLGFSATNEMIFRFSE